MRRPCSSTGRALEAARTERRHGGAAHFEGGFRDRRNADPRRARRRGAARSTRSRLPGVDYRANKAKERPAVAGPARESCDGRPTSLPAARRFLQATARARSTRSRSSPDSRSSSCVMRWLLAAGVDGRVERRLLRLPDLGRNVLEPDVAGALKRDGSRRNIGRRQWSNGPRRPRGVASSTAEAMRANLCPVPPAPSIRRPSHGRRRDRGQESPTARPAHKPPERHPDVAEKPHPGVRLLEVGGELAVGRDRQPVLAPPHVVGRHQVVGLLGLDRHARASAIRFDRHPSGRSNWNRCRLGT